ncbi:MAG: hypothetical protein WDM89_15725 [Rhizomicrobium sp.]
MTRRILGVAAAGALALGGLSAQAAENPPAAKSIVGTWLASYDGGTHIGYIQWQKGGTVLNEMDFAPKTGNILIGDWTANNDGTDTFTVFGWTYDDKGKSRTGYFTKTETDTVSGTTYGGNFEVTYYDLSGNITFQHSGSLTATRVSAQ